MSVLIMRQKQCIHKIKDQHIPGNSEGREGGRWQWLDLIKRDADIQIQVRHILLL